MSDSDQLSLPEAQLPNTQLSNADLMNLRCPNEILGFVLAVLAMLSAVVFLPQIEIPLVVLALIAIVVAVITSAVRQASLVSNAVPLEQAIGAGWAIEFDQMLRIVGRRPGSVSVVVTTDPYPNAFAIWRPGARGIVITSGLIELAQSDPSLVRAALAHELGHLIYGHVACLMVFSGWAWLTAIRVMLLPVSILPLFWERNAERSADRLSAVMTSPIAAAQSLLALHQGSFPTTVQLRLMLDGFQHPDRLSGFLARFGQLFSSHPFLVPRVRGLLNWAQVAPSQPWWKPVLNDRWMTDLAILGFRPNWADSDFRVSDPIRPTT